MGDVDDDWTVLWEVCVEVARVLLAFSLRKGHEVLVADRFAVYHLIYNIHFEVRA